MGARVWLLAVSVAIGNPAVASPQVAPEPWCFPGYHVAMAFPLQTKVQHPTLAAHCFLPNAADRARVQLLQNHRCVRLQGLAIPGGGVIDL